MPSEVGKRYICKTCNSEMIVTKKGEGTLSCCQNPMELKK